MGKEEDSGLEELKKKSRNYSIKEGIFSTIKESVSGNYITPFAIAINSPNYMIGLLTSVPGLLGPMSEWKSSGLIGRHSRKKIILRATFFEILTWIPLIAISLLYYYGIIRGILPLMLLIFFSLYVITANAASPAWFSWIGDLVDENQRGRWFGKRTAIFGMVTIISTLSAAFLLDFLKTKNLTLFGFIALFFIALVSRIISRHYLSKHYEPVIKIEKEHYFSFFTFVKKAPYNNFGRFVIFKALISGAVAISGPFFVVYMLRDLHFNYLTMTLVQMSGTFFTLIFINWWGKFSDRYGNYQVFRITLILIVFSPISWVFSKSPVYLIFFPQLLSGVAWGGFNLAASNYIFDCVTPQKRGLALSYADLLNGIGVFIGGITGTVLVLILKINFINIFLFIFIISGVCRLIIGLIMLPKIKEVKSKEKFNRTFLFRRIIPKKD